MKGTASCFLGAAALFVLGLVCWRVADFEREIAAAQRDFATMSYADVEATFERAVDLPEGRHLLQFEMVIRGQRTSRTIAVTLKEPTQ